MDDVMDELIVDSTDLTDEYQLIQRNSNSWLVDGQFPYFELLKYFGHSGKIDTAPFSTVAGLFISITYHTLTTGEKALWQNFQLEVLDMDGHRIDKIMVTKI